MTESTVSDTELKLPPPPETGIPVVDRTMDWVRMNYNVLVDLCDKNDIPRPPNW